MKPSQGLYSGYADPKEVTRLLIKLSWGLYIDAHISFGPAQARAMQIELAFNVELKM